MPRRKVASTGFNIPRSAQQGATRRDEWDRHPRRQSNTAQPGHRPLVHADQHLGRGQGHFGGLLAHVGQELPGRPPRLVGGEPGNAAATGSESTALRSPVYRRARGNRQRQGSAPTPLHAFGWLDNCRGAGARAVKVAVDRSNHPRRGQARGANGRRTRPAARIGRFVPSAGVRPEAGPGPWGEGGWRPGVDDESRRRARPRQ